MPLWYVSDLARIWFSAQALTSGVLGFEFRPKPWAGLVVGYKSMGIDFGKEEDDEQIRKVDLTYYGPIFGLNLHWGGR